MQSVLLALVAFAATGAYGKCPASISAVTASVTQIFNGGRSPYDWTFSPTSLSNMAPNGATSCGPAYIAQYSGGNCDAKCDKQEKAPESSNGGCLYSFTDGEVRTMNIKLTCDAGATALTINNEVQVTQRGGGIRGLTYDFIGRYAGVCEGPTTAVPTTTTSETTATTAAPTSYPITTTPPAESTTVIILVSVGVALSIAGVILGIIAIVFLMNKRSCLRGDAEDVGDANLNTNYSNSPFILKHRQI